ncbi:Bax inhibitor-1/YccA family protein [Compostimonas suwonensis]|uniref:Putative YccA/Bax inhibitor family protein n=1 Tax=Compostimonas suwonensis TaxID=1048394 RepID=A0A2M9BV90_9MICO|nr:Bax inhibitor-1/YccA family protein [Compostimonas suwonensis]PJJ61865.1 putative YccA/Bax inhibitor family protein [Compostimonas suwonensis]
MALDNPAFSRNKAFQTGGTTTAVATPSAESLTELYNQPAATSSDTDRMTIEDSIMKSVVTFVFLLAGAAVGWILAPTIPFLWIGAGIVGFVLALVNIFKKEPSPALILAYSAVQGVFVGGISAFYETEFPGVVVQAVIATLVVVGVTLALFASGKIRASKKATKIFLIAMIGYAVFSLLNFVLMLTGVNQDPWGLRSAEIFGIPLGLIVGVLVVIMAAYSLVLDFDSIQQGVRNRAPRKYGWTGAFGIMVTVIWLYLELLRIFAIARD